MTVDRAAGTAGFFTLATPGRETEETGGFASVFGRILAGAAALGGLRDAAGLDDERDVAPWRIVVLGFRLGNPLLVLLAAG